MPILRLCFARWVTDIAAGKRTIALVSPLSATYALGDEVQLLATAPPDEETGKGVGGWQFGVTRRGQKVTITPFVRSASIVSVQLVKLLDAIDADLEGLGADTREEFLARWAAANPDLPADGNPEVSRVEWRYGEDADVVPEWSLAI
jgi:hypothetical protein